MRAASALRACGGSTVRVSPEPRRRGGALVLGLIVSAGCGGPGGGSNVLTAEVPALHIVAPYECCELLSIQARLLGRDMDPVVVGVCNPVGDLDRQ